MTALNTSTNDVSGAAGFENTAVPVDSSPLCLQCALSGHTCCQGHEIFVTRGDCRRIFSHTRRQDFFEYRQCLDIAYADQDDDPIWRRFIFRSDGSRRVLKQQPNGDCTFLGPSGCGLPLDVRPLICRLYPHLYSAAGIDGQWDAECPATRHYTAYAIESGIAGVAQDHAARWHQLLYHEIQWEGSADENWFDV